MYRSGTLLLPQPNQYLILMTVIIVVVVVVVVVVIYDITYNG
jgi:hypothetical protein